MIPSQYKLSIYLKSNVRTIWFEETVLDIWKKITLIFALNKNSGRVWIKNNNLVHFFAIKNENFQQNY